MSCRNGDEARKAMILALNSLNFFLAILESDESRRAQFHHVRPYLTSEKIVLLGAVVDGHRTLALTMPKLLSDLALEGPSASAC